MPKRKLGAGRWPLWLIPLPYLTFGIVAAFVFPRIEYAYFPAFVHVLSVGSAQAYLSAIASGTITLTALVFSVMFVVMQTAMTAYSKRLIMLFSGNPIGLHALGIFSATFMYALGVLQFVDRSRDGNVPMAIDGVCDGAPGAQHGLHRADHPAHRTFADNVYSAVRRGQRAHGYRSDASNPDRPRCRWRCRIAAEVRRDTGAAEETTYRLRRCAACHRELPDRRPRAAGADLELHDRHEMCRRRHGSVRHRSARSVRRGRSDCGEGRFSMPSRFAWSAASNRIRSTPFACWWTRPSWRCHLR